MLAKTVCLQKFAQLCLRICILFSQRVQAQLTGKAVVHVSIQQPQQL